jgi:hypothetical protein
MISIFDNKFNSVDWDWKQVDCLVRFVHCSFVNNAKLFSKYSFTNYINFTFHAATT